MGITPPEPLTPEHNIENFNCGKPELDNWLKKNALRSQDGGGARTFVVTSTESQEVVGFYCISAGSVEHKQLSGKYRRNMPDPIPVILLGRLAIDQQHARQGIGSGLMKDCYQRVLQVSDEIGIRALLVHALDNESRDYCVHLGFDRSPIQEHTLMVSVKAIKASLLPPVSKTA